MRNTQPCAFKLITTIAFMILASAYAKAQTIDFNQDWEVPSGDPDTLTRTVSYPISGGVYVLSSTRNVNDNMDISLIKYNSLGAIVWQQTYDHEGLADYGVNLVVSNNNVYVLGVINDSTTLTDFCLIKYSSSGVLQWNRITDGVNSGFDGPADIDADSAGNIYVVGSIAATNYLSDIYVQKIDPSNVLLWEQTYDYADLDDFGGALNVYSTYLTVAGISGSDVGVYDNVCISIALSDGSIISENRDEIEDGIPQYYQAYTTDEANNYYILGSTGTGSSQDIRMHKISESSGLVWSASFDNGLEDLGSAIVTDISGNVYVCGQTFTTEGSKLFISKYDVDGEQLWFNTFSPGPDYLCRGTDLKILDNGNILVTGIASLNLENEVVSVCFSENGEIRRAINHNDAVYTTKDPKLSVSGSNIFITGVAEEAGLFRGRVLKLSFAERSMDTTFVDSVASHVSEEIIVRFSRYNMLPAAVNKVGYNFGPLSNFIDSATIDSLEVYYPAVDWGRCRARKIFERLTMNDSISINRSGDSIVVASLWSALVIEVPGFDELIVIDSLNGRESRNILYAQLDYFFEPTIPNDEYWDEQDALNGDFSDADVNVLDAWDYENGSELIRVGVYDTGIKWNHEDFGGGFACEECAVKGGWDYSTNASLYNTINQGDPIHNSIFNGHGTKAAGVIGAIRNNDYGVAGIAGGDNANDIAGVSLYGFRVLLGGITSSKMCNALLEGTYNTTTGIGYGLHVMNCSFSSTAYWEDEPYEQKRLEIDCQRETFLNQTVLVASRGNDAGTDNHFPAYSVKEHLVISVGGMGSNGNRDPGSNWGSDMDLIAPYSPLLTHTTANNNSNDYSSFSGTSSAAPHVTGAVSLMLSYINNSIGYPNILVPEDIEFLLQRYATDRTGTHGGQEYLSGYDEYTGHGKLNIGNVLTHIDKSEYIIRHYTAEGVMPIDAGFAYEEILTSINEDGYPTGFFWANVYNLDLTIQNDLFSGDIIIDSWPLHYCSNLLKAEDASLGHRTNDLYESAIISMNNTQGVVRGMTVHFVEHVNGGAVDFWYPIAPGDAYSLGYSLHLQSEHASIKEENKSPLICYPNPTTQELNIELENKSSAMVAITIFDLSGRIIYNGSTTDEKIFTISTTDWPNGMYTISVNANNELYHEKIIKY